MTEIKTNSYADLFINLAKPDEDGFSRAVGTDEFVGEFSK